MPERQIESVWDYPRPPRLEPTARHLKVVLGVEAITGSVAFYASRMDKCFVDHELVTPQPGDFCGGWITTNIQGPFKGGPGTRGW